MYADARNCLQEGTMSEIESVKAVRSCNGIILDIRHTGHKFQVYLKNGQILKLKNSVRMLHFHAIQFQSESHT